MTAQSIAVKANPATYGAKELKELIRKHTYRAFIITSLILLILVLINVFSVEKRNPIIDLVDSINPVNTITLEQLANPVENDELAPPPDVQVVNTGPAARAGNPIPVPDAQITPEMQDFATMDVMSRASAEGGSGVDLGGFSSNISFDDDAKMEVKKVEEPDPGAFIPVEKQPATDMAELQKLVVYPEVAKKAGIEGKVILRVLVDTDGSVKKVLVLNSDSKMLDQAAIDAVSKATFTPAIQNKQPVMVWVSIPITFKLR